MIIPIRCFSCGKPIAQAWKQFKDRTQKGEDPKKVFEELGLERPCCRSIFVSHTDYIELVNKFKKY